MSDQETPPTSSRWKEAATSIGGCLLYLTFGLGGLVLLVFLILGAGWIKDNVYPWSTLAAGVAAVVVVPASLLIAIVRKSRHIAAIGLLVSSYVIGIGLWIWSLIVAAELAGIFWLAVGILLGGIGVVPVAFIAALLSLEWSIAGQILIVAIAVYIIRAFSAHLAERVAADGQNAPGLHEKVQAYKNSASNEIEIDNTLLSACRSEFGEGYGPSGLLVGAYADVIAKATIEDSRSRRKSQLPASPERIKQAIIEVAESAISRQQEHDPAIELLKIVYSSLARFLPESQALVVKERNLAWLSENPHHPGLRRSKEAESIDAQVDAEEARLAQEFDDIIRTILRRNLASAKRERAQAEKQLLEAFYELSPDDPDLVTNVLLEESSNLDLEDRSSVRYVRDALITWRQGDRERALYYFTKAVEIDPDDGATLVNRGNLQLEMGYFDDGIRDLERAREINPELPWQNALLFQMLSPDQRERTRQSMVNKKYPGTK